MNSGSQAIARHSCNLLSLNLLSLEDHVSWFKPRWAIASGASQFCNLTPLSLNPSPRTGEGFRERGLGDEGRVSLVYLQK
ncbi:MAG: hypothetical protein F6K30_22680 [Cyanothece sp. SIO2G6]|nr:hypothetical protein [Cyanothece sp. SIO2G6]